MGRRNRREGNLEERRAVRKWGGVIDCVNGEKRVMLGECGGVAAETRDKL